MAIEDNCSDLSSYSGEDYHFVTQKQMDEQILAGLFIEAGKYNGHLYGTSIAAIKTWAEKVRTTLNS